MKKTERIKIYTENIFEEYLTENKIKYQKDFKVENGDIDFLIEHQGQSVYCDVKAILETIDHSTNHDISIKRLRSDIQKLRNKFERSQPELPCVLVSMNLSNNSITGFNVVRAMYGEATISIDKNTFDLIKPLHHSPTGNAKMTKIHNTVISGILAFQTTREGNYYFHNENAINHIPMSYFPKTSDVITSRNSLRDDIDNLGMIFIS